ncbi:MAG: FecR domain-containing protein [Leptolyngbyaceae cyanobacterium]
MFYTVAPPPSQSPDVTPRPTRRSSLLKRACQRAALGVVGVATLLGTVTLSQSQAQTGRWLEVERLTGPVFVQQSQSRPAGIGDRLTQVGHSITTQSQASTSLALDTEIGSVAVAQNTHLKIERLDVLSNGGRVTVLEVTRGQARVQARPFTNPNTLLEIWTPSGVAAVRGTDFGVAVDDEGKTSIATLEGSVEATAESVMVTVDEGLAAVIRPGEPPTTPIALDRELAIEGLTQERRGNILTVTGRINPTNTLQVGDLDIEVSRSGYFEWQANSARRNRSVAFTVSTPLCESRLYRILPWQVPDLDRGGNGGGDNSGGDSGKD